MKKIKAWPLFVGAIFSLLFSLSSMALEVPPIRGPVMDLGGVLSNRIERHLTLSLKALYSRSNIQIQVLTIPSLEGEVLENYSIKVVDKWQLGKEGSDKGVLFLVAVRDRKMRIEVGRGLEGELTDIQAGRIIRQVVTPYFKQGDFDSGIYVGVSSIAGAAGEKISLPKGTKRYRRKRDDGFGLFDIIFYIVILLFIMGTKSRGLLWFLLGSSMGRSSRGGWYSGGSGGSFGGGWSSGGGGFSGGGASGSW